MLEKIRLRVSGKIVQGWAVVWRKWGIYEGKIKDRDAKIIGKNKVWGKVEGEVENGFFDEGMVKKSIWFIRHIKNRSGRGGEKWILHTIYLWSFLFSQTKIYQNKARKPILNYR